MLGAAALLPASRLPATAGNGSLESSRLDALLVEIAGEFLLRSPELATSLGLDKDDDAHRKAKFGDHSLASRAADASRATDQLRRLRAIDRGALTGLDAVNYDTVAWSLDREDQDRRASPYGTGSVSEPYVISQLTGAYQWVPDFLDSQHTVETREDAEAYLTRLEDFGIMLDGELEMARFDAGIGAAPPRFIIDRALGQLRPLAAEPSGVSTVVTSIARRTGEKGIAGDYGARATAIHAERIGPALRRQAAFLDGLLPKATEEAGIARLPAGDQRYLAALRSGTTTTISPDEAHRTGLDQVASLNGRLDAALARQGLTAGTVGQRLRALFEDTRFRYPNTDEGKAKLIADCNRKAEAIAARLPSWFGALPRARVEIRRVPPATEAGASSQYQSGSLDGSRPGAFYISLRDTAEQPSWLLPTLTYHEAIPGHHLAIALSNEAALPLLRKLITVNAYDEGWALYAEQLAEEMGVYEDDPFGQIGYLHDALLRAARLVIDTGLHAFGWSRDGAIRYYVDTLGDPESAATAEVERYCVWPGQACGYMVGKLTLLRLRELAQAKLGPRFDIRRFHDACLLSGAVPLERLEDVIRLQAGG